MSPMPRAPEGVVELRSRRLVAWVIPFGARLMQLWWLGAPEGPRPLSLGFASPEAYREDTMALGAVCGRYANRIADAVLERDGRRWKLDVNHALGHCLHGGRAGFGVRDWEVAQRGEAALRLRLHSPDGDQGFPGACEAEVEYALEEGALLWTASARTSAACPVNLVQHSYWNLDATPDLAGHRIQVAASSYLPVDARELPGQPVPVQDSWRDWRAGGPIPAQRVPELDSAMLLDTPAGSLREVARLQAGGLELRLLSDQALLHLYAGAGLRPTQTPLGVEHRPGAGLCLETEAWPNGPALGRAEWYDPQHPYQHRMRLEFEGA